MTDLFGLPPTLDWEATRKEIAKNIEVSYAALAHRKAIVSDLTSPAAQRFVVPMFLNKNEYQVIMRYGQIV